MVRTNFAELNWTISQEHYPAIGLLTGIVLVVLYGARYFSETKVILDSDQSEEVELLPFTAQASTVRGRFVFWQAAFCFSLVAIYIVLLALVEGTQLPNAPEAVVSSFGILAPLLSTRALVLALIVTGAIPNTPVLSKGLEFLRKWMHGRARIPERFSSIYQALRNSITAGNIDLRRAATLWEGKPNLIKIEDFDTVNTRSAEYWMSRSLYVLAFIDYLRCRDPRKATYKKALVPYDTHLRRVDAQLREGIGLYQNLPSIPSAHLDLLWRRLRGQCLRLVQVCISVVFLVEYSDPKALEKLGALNGDVEEHVHPSPPYDFYVVSCIILFVLAFLLIGIGDLAKEGAKGITRETFKHAFSGAAISAMIMPLPGVLIAIGKNTFQNVWPYRLPGQSRQLLPYVICAAGAYVFTLCVLYIFVAADFTQFETLGNGSIPGFAIVGAAFGLVSALCIDASRELWTFFPFAKRAQRVAAYCVISVIITCVGCIVSTASAIALSDSVNLGGEKAVAAFKEFTATSVKVVGCLTILHVTFTLAATKRNIRFHTRRDLKRFVLDQAGVSYERETKEEDLNHLISARWASIDERFRNALIKTKIFLENGAAGP